MESNPWDVRPSANAYSSVKNRRSCQERLVEKIKLNRDLSVPVSKLKECSKPGAKICVLRKFGLEVANEDDTLNNSADCVPCRMVPLKEVTPNVQKISVHKEVKNNNYCVAKFNEISKSHPRPLQNLQKCGSFMSKAVGLETNNNTVPVASNENTPQDIPPVNCELKSSYADVIGPKPKELVDIDLPEPVAPSSVRPSQVICVVSAHKTGSRAVTTNRTFNPPTKNYLKLNLRKKCFSKKGAMRQRFLQRQVRHAKFKRKFSAWSKEGSKCFRCGVTGHWANKCPATVMESKTPVESNTNERYASRLATAIWRILDTKELDRRYMPAQLEDLYHGHNVSPGHVTLEKTPNSVNIYREQVHGCLQKMGFKSFRPGQELIILRTLFGISSLAVLPTAAGKSLCYQIPATILQKEHGSVALIVSPLISLMQDQILNFSSDLDGAYLNSSQSLTTKEEILEKARNGQYAFLLVSPEALVETDWLLQPGRLPKISFVCVDEAHCLADWSHHFRPSYLRVCQILRNSLGVRCFLGLSATCTPSTIANVCKNLGMPESSPRLAGDRIDEETLLGPGYVQPTLSPIPTNLIITASTDSSRDEALLGLLTRAPFNELTGGILVYCATRDQTERLASFVRTSLQSVVDKVGRRRLEWSTAAYHAGQTSSERARIQKRFMTGRLRVLFATSAFGMGVNKSDLQAVIHYSLTRSFENYIQEIGRVGRSNQVAYCHAFLPPGLLTDPQEANELRRHIFANHIDVVMVKRLLRMMFQQVSCTCRPSESGASFNCQGHVHTIDPAQVERDLDIKPESLATVLAYMELDTKDPLVTILQHGYRSALVDCYGGPAEMAYASQHCLAVAAGISVTCEEKNVSERSDFCSTVRQLTLDLPYLCNRWGWRPSTVRQELKNLEWHGSAAGHGSGPHRTGIQIQMSDWSWWFWIHQVPVREELLENCLTSLIQRLHTVETAGLTSLDQLTRVLAQVAKAQFDQIYPDQSVSTKEMEMIIKEREERSSSVHKLIQTHFQTTQPNATLELPSKSEALLNFSWPPPVTESQIQSVRSKVREFLGTHGPSLGEQITGRCLANLFHGISSPQFPAKIWARNHHVWRRHLDIDWPELNRVASEELRLNVHMFV